MATVSPSGSSKTDVLRSFSSPSTASTMLPATIQRPRSRAKPPTRRIVGPSVGSAPARIAAGVPSRLNFSGRTTSSAPASAASRISDSAVARFRSLSSVELSCTAAARKLASPVLPGAVDSPVSRVERLYEPRTKFRPRAAPPSSAAKPQGAPQLLLRLGKRPVRHELLPVTNANTRRRRRRLELVARGEDAFVPQLLGESAVLLIQAASAGCRPVAIVRVAGRRGAP